MIMHIFQYLRFFLNHAKKLDEIIKKLKLNHENFVVEIASNDGYLLKNFKEKKYLFLELNRQRDYQNH